MTDRTVRTAAGAAAVFALEIRRLLRSRGALAVTFLSPVAISSIVVFALGSTDDLAPSRIGWATSGHGPAAAAFADDVVGEAELAEFVEWQRTETIGELRAAVEDEEVGAGIVIGESPGPGEPPQLELVGNEDPLASGVAATIADEFLVRSTVAVQAAGSGVAAPEAREGLVLAAPGGRSLDAAVHWGPALGGFLVLLAMGYPAHRQVDDRLRGMTGRMASTVTPRAALAVGRALASTASGAAALATMALSTQIVFDRAWGPLPLIGLLIGATALAVAGIGAVIATVARTGGQAQTLTAVVGFGLAIVGGSFTPLGSGSSPGGLTRWLPTSLSLEGFSAAATTGALADAAAPVAVLAGTGASLLVISVVASNREVQR